MEDRDVKTGLQGEKYSREEEMKAARKERKKVGEREWGSTGGEKGGRYNEVLWVCGGRSHSARQPTQPGSVQMVAWRCVLTSVSN